MTISQNIAKHLREVYFGGNWTVSCLKEHLSDISWEEAVRKIDDFNTIAALVYHINYFIRAVTPVLSGQVLNASDKLSFDHPPIQSKTDWDIFLEQTWRDAEKLIMLIENLPDEKLGTIFVIEKYGIYYRNLHGLIEHTHYHLGQIVIIKKLIKTKH